MEIATDRELLEKYSDIEKTARNIILGERAIGNGFASGAKKDTRWSVSTQALLYGSPAHDFLISAADELKRTGEDIRYVPNNFLHLTTGEVLFNADGRRNGFDCQKARQYYQALATNLPVYEDIPTLYLDRVFPTADSPNDQRSSVAIVASFLTHDQPDFFNLRAAIPDAIKAADLDASSRLGMIRVLFTTLGRFSSPPTVKNGTSPVLEAIERINSGLPENLEFPIRSIDIFSTSKVSYSYPEGFIYFGSEITLNNGRYPEDFRLSTPYQRLSRSPFQK